MKEYKVGEQIVLEVRKAKWADCEGCYFNGENRTCKKLEMKCCPDERSDGNKVIFVEKGK